MLLCVHNVVTQDRAGSGGRKWETGGAGGEQVQYSAVGMDYGCRVGRGCGLGRIVGCGPWGKMYVCM